MTGSSSASLSTKAAVFLGALVAGTGCSLTSKMLLSMKSVGASGEVEDFENPLFQTWGMFIGMCMALPVHLLHVWCTRPRKGYASIQTAEGGAKPDVTAHTLLVLALPSLFDLAATALCMFELVFIPVSVYQMLRGGAIVFVAILKHTALGDKLASFQWAGVGLISVSIVLVGLSANSGADDASKSNPLLGVALILLGALIQALQYAFEEKVMSAEVGVPPLLVIGMEGVWGTLICTVVVYPVMMAWGIEDPYDTYVLLSNSAEIRSMFLLYFLCIFAYNMLAVLVTFLLDSVWHAILDNFRPITVWGTDLALFYAVTGGTFGEAWAFPGSYIQLCGLGVLLWGTAVYNGDLSLPCLEPGQALARHDTMDRVLASPLTSPRTTKPERERASPVVVRKRTTQEAPV